MLENYFECDLKKKRKETLIRKSKKILSTQLNNFSTHNRENRDRLLKLRSWDTRAGTKAGDQEKSDRALLAWSSNLYVLYSYVRVDRISFRSEKVLRGSSGTIINFNGASTVPRGGNRCENVSCWGERLATYNSTPWFWSIHELTRPWFFCIPLRERLSHSIAVLCSYWLFRTHREMKNMRYTSVVIGLKLVRELMECIDLKKIYRVKGFVEGFGEWKWFDISAYEIFFFFN